MSAPTGNWNYPTAMRFGAGRISELPDACKALGMARPLLVTDPGLAAMDMVRDALGSLEGAGLKATLFSAIKPNPTGDNVNGGVAAYRDAGSDGVVAFGGGSALDAGKAVAFMAGQLRPIWDFEDVGDNWVRADGDAIAPVVAVPTTAGTGSEVGRASVITDAETHSKKIIFHPKMLPGQVISDPELTVGLPPHITAATGMDALAHCFEAYCAPGYHPMADGIGLEGMRLVKENLINVYQNGNDIEGRANMLAAAAMGATAFQKGLGAIHSLSHPVGAVYDAHHGLCNAVFFPYVMVFNKSAIGDKMTRLGRWLDLIDPSFDGVLAWVLELRRELGIPHTAESLGLEESRLDELAAMAEADPSTGGNPRPANANHMRAMFEAALTGKLD